MMKQDRADGTIAPGLVIGGLGFFALLVQTLLFREFLTVFEGSELAVGCFFSSWLVWVAVGALLGRVEWRALPRVLAGFEWLALLYLPAFVVQCWWLREARDLAGVAHYELFPFLRLVKVAFPAAAPIPLVTGLLFTWGCRWLAAHHPAAVARVFIWEALGAGVGGAVVTLLLATGASTETVFLDGAIGLSSLVTLSLLRRRTRWLAVALPLVLLAASWWGLDRRWTAWAERRAWGRLLPIAGFQGSFVTPQARYLYGHYGAQFNVLAWEGVVETIPEREHAAQVAALHLVQQPRARRFLVVGQGSYALCAQLLALPQTTKVTWLTPDPAYPAQLFAAWPPDLPGPDPGLDVPGTDVRAFLAATTERYDLIILNLPSATTLTLNGYFTREFFLLLKQRLSEQGVVGVRTAGGEHYLGRELVAVGAAVYHTLGQVFPQVVIKPGDETWLLASERAALSTRPAVLAGRYVAIPGAAAMYPREGVLAQYPPERIAFQEQHYRTAIAADAAGLLTNTDAHPRALFHALLVMLLQTGVRWPLLTLCTVLAVGGVGMAGAAIGVCVLLRAIYRMRTPLAEGGSRPPGGDTAECGSRPPGGDIAEGGSRPPGGDSPGTPNASSAPAEERPEAGRIPALPARASSRQAGPEAGQSPTLPARASSRQAGPEAGQSPTLPARPCSTTPAIAVFDCHFLVFSTGLVGMGTTIVLMFQYQARFGALFLHLGLVSALYMLGLAGGGRLGEWLAAAGRAAWSRAVLATAVVLHLLLLLAVGHWGDVASREGLALMVLVAGAIGGLYVPLAAARLQVAGLTAQRAGGLVEWDDHLGGALGGVLTAVLLLPLLGNQAALGLLALLLAANLVALAPLERGGGALTQVLLPSAPAQAVTRWGSALRSARYLLFGVAAFLVVAVGQYRGVERQLHEQMPAASTDATLTPAKVTVADGREAAYFVRRDSTGGVREYVFDSEQFVPRVNSFGGPLALRITTDAQGKLLDFTVTVCRDTPAYLNLTREWQQALRGRNIFQPEALADVDGVTGATYSVNAIRRTLELAGAAFGVAVTHQTTVTTVSSAPSWGPEIAGGLLLVLMGAALVLRSRPSRWGRRVLLLLTLGVAGWWLNAQYSLDNVQALLGWQWPGWRLSGAFVLTLAIPVLVLIVGNHYCGWLCPFGAAQELLGDLRPPRWRTDPSPGTWQAVRPLRSLLLWTGLALGLLGAAAATLGADPLVWVWSGRCSGLTAWLAVGALGAAFFYPRFWCRTLCPAGAFLSLLSRGRWVRWLTPAVSFRRCSFGVTEATAQDCLRCDRCRLTTAAEREVLVAIREEPASARSRSLFAGAAIGATVAVIWLALTAWPTAGEATGTAKGMASVAPATEPTEAPGASATDLGKPRPVDLRRLREMLEHGELSDHEAQHYRPLPEEPPPAAR